MPLSHRLWTRLGLGAATLGATTLAACGATEAGEAATAGADPIPSIAYSGEAGEGEGGEGGEGEGGEGGEGGVNVAAAATNPAVFRAALAVVDAHVLAARDAYAAGRTDTAAAMFAHPVSEVYLHMESVFEAQGVAPFDMLLTNASRAALEGETPDEIAARSEAILAASAAAAAKAPESPASKADIAARVTADQIERAAQQYLRSTESDDYEPYLDGYGFLAAARAVYTAEAEAIRAETPAAADALEAAMALLDEAYPSAARPATLDADTAALVAASSLAILETGGL